MLSKNKNWLWLNPKEQDTHDDDYAERLQLGAIKVNPSNDQLPTSGRRKSYPFW